MITIKKWVAAIGIAAVVAVIAPLASANITDGMYFSGYIGASKTLDNSYLTKDKTDTRYGLKHDYGFNIGAAIGYRFDCYRTEFSIAHTTNHNDRIDLLFNGAVTANSPAKNRGDQSSTIFMLNAYYDFITGSGFVPFVGAGIGAAHLRNSYTLDTVSMRSNDTVFAYQVILGVGCDFTENVRATLDYRFIGTTKGEFRARMGTTSKRVRGDYFNHQINLGLTYFI